MSGVWDLCIHEKSDSFGGDQREEIYIYDEKCNFQRGSSKKKLETTDRRKCVYALET